MDAAAPGSSPEESPDGKMIVRVDGKRVYCAWDDCGKKLEKGRSYYCLEHDFWPR